MRIKTYFTQKTGAAGSSIEPEGQIVVNRVTLGCDKDVMDANFRGLLEFQEPTVHLKVTSEVVVPIKFPDLVGQGFGCASVHGEGWGQ